MNLAEAPDASASERVAPWLAFASVLLARAQEVMRMRRALGLVVTGVLVAGLLGGAALGSTGGARGDAADTVGGWTLEQQIGQLILFEVEVSNPRYLPPTGATGTAVDELLGLHDGHNLAGFTLEEGNRDLFLDPRLGEVGRQDILGVRPFVAVNEEGGTVQVAQQRTFDQDEDWIGCTNLGPLARFVQRDPVPWGGFRCVDATWPPPGEHSEREDRRYFPYLRDAFAMASGTSPGERWTPRQTRRHLEDVGRALVRINANLDLAPVLGVSDGTTTSSLLGDRVFADDPQTVTKYAAHFSEVIHEGSKDRVATVVKHFPGLGTVVMNTDDAPGVSAPRSELKRESLVPYEHLDRYDALAVMMSDAAVPGPTCPADATADECIAQPPASLTKAAYELLRSEPYGWDGVIVTDTLAGGAIIYGGRTIEQAASEAVAAGADLIEIKPTPPPGAAPDWAPSAEDNEATIAGAIAAIKAWAGDDEARLRQIEESATRVVTAKQMGLSV
jgi:beta-glucosidase-like glycosyl hydrolase